MKIRSLNFHHLRYFWTVAKEGHLTRSAKQLNVSQSALSSQIRQLEAHLGQALFIRQGRSLQLTDTGQLVLEYADSIFNLSSELISILESGEMQKVQTLRVGAVATLSRNFQENFLKPILGKQDIRLVIHSSTQEELLDKLQMHKLDIVLSNRPVASDSSRPWRCRLIDQQKVCLVGSGRETLDQLTLPRDLNKTNLLVPGPQNEIRLQFDMYCEQHGIKLTPYAEVDDMAMLRLLARDVEALAVVPEVVVQDEIELGVLKKYLTLDSVTECFYAITAERHFDKSIVNQLINSAAP